MATIKHKKKQPTDSSNSVAFKNGWDSGKNKSIHLYLHKLKHNQVISSFFFFQLKSKESLMSWWLIILSTFSTTLTGLNNLEEGPFNHFFLSIQIGLGTFSVLTTLIAAWMKKERFVERINEIDRYVQKLTILIEEIDFQLVLNTSDRIIYEDFKKKYHQQISEMLSTSPSLSPKEWKHTIYTITKYYPEMINSDGSPENKLWPWYTLGTNNEGIVVRRVSPFGMKVLNTYHTSTYKGYIIDKCCPCFLNKVLLYPDPQPSPPPPSPSQPPSQSQSQPPASPPSYKELFLNFCSCSKKGKGKSKDKSEDKSEDKLTDQLDDKGNITEKVIEQP